MKLAFLNVAASIVIVAPVGANDAARTPSAPITVEQVRSLNVTELAVELLGARLGSKVGEIIRHEYGSPNEVPGSVDLFTRPELAYPLINGICQTDVITVDFNYVDSEGVTGATPLTINHVKATSRFKAFPMPPGEPGTPANERAQVAACSAMKTALDAFRAPSAGDAQLLADIEEQYMREPKTGKFSFSCDDFEDATCKKAQRILPALRLNTAIDVKTVDCPAHRKRTWARFCYQLTFPYQGTTDPAWIMNVTTIMRGGIDRVEIGKLKLQHERAANAIF